MKIIKNEKKFICDMEEWGWVKQLYQDQIKRCYQQCDECKKMEESNTKITLDKEG